MSRLVECLEAKRAEGGGAGELAALAAELLSDVAVTGADLKEPGAVIAEARVAFGAMAAECRGAFSKYPAVRGAGFHSGDSDPRSFAIYSTFSEVRKVGMYTPDDLAEMLTGGGVTEGWVAAESLRLGAFLVVLRWLMDEVDRRRLNLQGYREGIAAAARELGGVRVAVGSA